MTDRELEAKVSQRYRELPAEEPPRALDEAILAAARREVRARPAPLVAPTGRRRWYVPVAAAAVIVLAVAVTLRVQLEQPDLESGELRAPAPQAARPGTKKEEKSAEARPTAKAPARVEKPELTPKPAPEPKPFAESAPAAAPELEPASRAAAGAAAPPAAAMRAPAPAMKPAPRGDDLARDRAGQQAAGTMAAKRMQEAAPTPERELERIAELRKAGRHDEADKALAEFRKRYPDYRIPEAMLEKVERR